MKQESYNKLTAKDSVDVFFNYCGTEICEPTFTAPPHIRQEYLVHYIMSGSGTFTSPAGTFPLKQGDIFLISPGQVVSYTTNPWDPFHFSWIAFSGKRVPKLLKDVGLSDESPVRHLHSRYSIHDIIMDSINLIDAGVGTNEYFLTANIWSIFGLISKSYHSDLPGDATSENTIKRHVTKATSFIKLNYMNPIHVGDVSQFIGLDRSYFSKIFHQETGKTIQEYLMETRIHQAKLLLESTNYPIKEISSFVGFTDECYFSRAFKKVTGISPYQYRLRIKNDE